ncbi:MAG: ABC transporter ATP-binding protein [Chitinophaga sp.]|uniref:ABC transporter ATP-binding protein n=1 Tax=Chitinophaga sp. TaxID=1869181 RepID=UPI001B21771B|nr:ABC transporter ATP-binding protein [Chitinophaga sp.]MBO9728340.1 ABC transporter ATP-binding protein [Chitinophaga sp.]
MITTCVLIFLENAFFLLSAWSFKELINVVPGMVSRQVHSIQSLLPGLLRCMAGALCYTVVRSLSAYFIELQGATVNEYLDDKIHEKANQLNLSFYESPEYFDTLKRAKDAGSDKSVNIVITFIEAIKHIIMLGTLSLLVMAIAWELIPLLIACILPAFLVRMTLARRLHKRKIMQTPVERQAAYLSSLLVDDKSAKEIRTFNLGMYLKEKYLRIRLMLLAERAGITRTGTFYSIITDILATFVFFICVLFICYKVINSAIKPGEITPFLLIFPQVFMVLQQLSTSLVKLYHDHIFLGCLFKLFDLKSTLPEASHPVPIPSTDKQAITVSGLHFTYPHSSVAALTDINLTFPSGKIIAIVGFNGAGKTTLIKMLCRLYDPGEGTIALGGTDIREYSITEYRRQVATVFQDFGRYNFSVAENICMGDVNVAPQSAAMHNAAVAAGADRFIAAFPRQYETVLGRLFEDGQEISMGQWQKIAIARVLYGPAKFIILDEATSALDAKSEKIFFESLKDNIGTRGALIISHRLSAVQHADYIYVLADGRITQEGTHDALIATGGDYANLFSKNAKHSSVTI